MERTYVMRGPFDFSYVFLRRFGTLTDTVGCGTTNYYSFGDHQCQ